MKYFDLNPYKLMLSQYGEIRVQENRSRNISITNGKMIKNERLHAVAYPCVRSRTALGALLLAKA